MENMAKVVNASPNASIHIPTTKYKLKKLIQPIIKSETHIKCNKCSNYCPSSTNEIVCKFCNSSSKTSNSDYFVYIPIEQQIKQSIEANIDKVLDYHSAVQSNEEIGDIHNAKIFINHQYRWCKNIPIHKKVSMAYPILSMLSQTREQVQAF